MPHDKSSRPTGARTRADFVNPAQRRGQTDPVDPFPPWSSTVADATAYVDTVVSQQLWEMADAMADAQATVGAAVADAQAAVSAAIADAASVIAQQVTPFSPADNQPPFPHPGSAGTYPDIAAQEADQTMAAVDAEMGRIGVRPLDPAQPTAAGRSPFGSGAFAARGRPLGATKR